MNRITKATFLVTTISVLAAASVFAKDNHKKDYRRGRPDSAIEKRDDKFDWHGMSGRPFGFGMGFAGGTGFAGGAGFGNLDESKVIGTVKSVDEKKGTITVALTDGKTKDIAVTPFTGIFVADKAREFAAKRWNEDGKRGWKGASGKKQEASSDSGTKASGFTAPSISDIEVGKWVMVSLYKTESSVATGASVFVK